MTRALTVVLGAIGVAIAVAGCGGPTFNLGVPFAVTSTVPSAASSGVGVDVLPQVGFNRAVDLASASAGITLHVGDNSPLEVTVAPRDGAQVIELIPRRALPHDTDVTLAVSGAFVKSADDGTKLEGDVAVSFHTAP